MLHTMDKAVKHRNLEATLGGMMLCVIFLLIVFGFCGADYDCLCSYDVEKPVLDLPTQSSQTIGYMYEFDCKPIVKVNGTDTKSWTALAFEKQLGYVEMNGQLQVQICPGDPSPTDAITTLSPTTTSDTQTMSVYSTKLSTQSHSQTQSVSTTTLPTSVPSSDSSTSIATTKTTTSTFAPTTTTTRPTAVPIKTTQSSTVTANSTTLIMKKITTTLLKTFPSSMQTTSSKLITSIDTTKSRLPSTAISVTQATFPTTYIKSSTNTTNKYSTMPSKTRQPFAATTIKMSRVPMTTRPLSTSISTTSQSTTLSTTDLALTTTSIKQSTMPTTSHRQSTLIGTTQSTTPTTRKPTTTHHPTISSTTTPSTTTSTPTPRTTQTTMTTTPPAVMIPANLGNITLCSASVVQYAKQDKEILTQLGDSCYTIVPHKVSWSHAEAVCNHRGGHLFHVRNSGENLFFYITLNTRFNHSVWLGLHDTVYEEHFQWTSGATLNYTNWIPGRKSNFLSHNVEDCAVFIPFKDHGKWDDIVCGANSPLFEHIMEEHYFICQFPIRSSAPATHQVTSGDINLCPSQMRLFAHLQGNHIGQYGASCYEHIPVRETWYAADQDCRRKRGHLLQIEGPQEESYIQTFLTHVDSQHAVWIGLHDQGHEETFTWTSGERLAYTNWLPGRRSNFFSHSVENCVALIPYKQGQWDDVPCGGLLVQSGSGLHQRVEMHPYICEFHIASSGGPSLIGK